ncbi:MAG: ketopantoate reductase family protein [Thermoplasmata archaeon]
MNVLVFGAGAIGSFVGARLAKVCGVTLIGRKEHVARINAHGLEIEGLVKECVKIPAFEQIPDGIWDFIIITTKSYDTPHAIQTIARKLDCGTIVSMQNGLNNIEVIEHETQKIKKKFNVCACITSTGVSFLEPGKIRLNGLGRTVVGGREKKYADKFAALLTAGGIKTDVSEDIMQEIWIKGVVNSAINPLTAIFRVKNGALLDNPSLEKLLCDVAEESEKIAKDCGFVNKNVDCVEITKEVAHTTRENYSSMLQDIMKGKKTEIREINGHIVETGKKHGLSVKLNQFLLNAVIGLEQLTGFRLS